MNSPERRWNDQELDELHTEFRIFAEKFDTHIGDSSYEQKQQQELYRVVFQREDQNTNTNPGMLQMLVLISKQLRDHLHLTEERDTKLEGIGGLPAIVERARFVDAMIARNEKHIRMMEKVESSGMVWAFIAFIGFLAVALWEYVRSRV